MKISVATQLQQADVLILPLFDEQKENRDSLAFLMPSTRKLIQDHLNLPYFKCKKNQHLLLHPEKEPFAQMLIVGLGKEKKLTQDETSKIIGSAIKLCRKYKLKTVQLVIPVKQFLLAICEGALLANYSFDRYITEKKHLLTHIEALTFVEHKTDSNTKHTIKKAEIMCETISYVRDLVNTPAAEMPPSVLAEHAKKIAKLSHKIKVRIFEKKQLIKMGMGLLVGVGQGSKHEPRLIVLEYKNKPVNKKPIVLAGKGITFDTGGMNLKPGSYMDDMKMDKAGASTVLGIFKVLAQLEPHLHVVGIAACAENSVTEYATKPGDIHKSYSGKTVEITNTDAEGRLVLGDALSYGVKNYSPEAIIDMATLTGACIVALGHEISAVLTNNQPLADKILQASKNTGEKMWQLPLDSELEKKVKGTISDLQNHTKGASADTIMGAAFLKQFVEKTPWAHLDIAGTAWSKEDQHCFSKGGTGVPLKTIWQFLEDYK